MSSSQSLGSQWSWECCHYILLRQWNDGHIHTFDWCCVSICSFQPAQWTAVCHSFFPLVQWLSDLTPIHFTMALVCLFDSTLTAVSGTMALLPLPCLYLTLCDTTTLYNSSTWLCLGVIWSIMSLLVSLLLYHGSTWLYTYLNEFRCYDAKIE